ncbi:alpha-amylase [Gemmatimonadetes bacterium T265]|nr:alpha-amylase [Gemmatimonadetes bacterium T265]
MHRFRRTARAARHALVGLLAGGALVIAPSRGTAQPAGHHVTDVPNADRWWREGAFYQVYPRSFQDSNGDGVGDLKGVTGRLDYLQWLGVDAIWISPFFRSPQRDFGYDVSDYTAVDPRFGTLADFDSLARAAHARGLHVILDFVANHTSDQHAWFADSRASRTSAKRDWYVWRDPAPGGGPPNNWRSVFGGSAWTLDSASGQYYFHQFLREQPDLNWRNPAVRRAMYDVMRFWLDRGADGFRLDAFPHTIEDSLFRDNPVAKHPDTGHGDYDLLEPLYTTHRPENFAILCEMRRVMDAYTTRGGRPSARILLPEVFTTPQKLTAYYGERGCGAQLPSNYALSGVTWAADTVYARVTAYEGALAPWQARNWALGNHDSKRLATRLGPAAARAAAVLLLTLRGTPTIYYGDEIGMHNVPIPPELVQDPAEKQQPGIGVGRDPERTPMQWESGPEAGFTTGTPWLPIATDANTVNVAAERREAESMLALYHDLLALRRGEPALARGTFRMLPRQGAVLAYIREVAGRDRFLIVVNFANAPGRYTVDARERTRLGPDRTTATVVAGTNSRAIEASVDRVSLRPNEAVVLRIPAARR